MKNKPREQPPNAMRRLLLTSTLMLGGGLGGNGFRPAFAASPGNSKSELKPRNGREDVLIVGAGPFGLGLAAYAESIGLSVRLLGEPMGFWRDNMPEGMLLRSSCNWSLDPLGINTIDAFLEERKQVCGDIEPVSRKLYLDYAQWFQQQKNLGSENKRVESLSIDGQGLSAAFDDGEQARFKAVVVAIGFENFSHTPADLAALFPPDVIHHTCQFVDFSEVGDQRILIIGGRQSAFEWTALIREAGARDVHVCYRHDTPAFEESDWSWVNPIVERMADDPGWYRNLSEPEKQQLNQRFWQEGRGKLEPWLTERLDHPNVHLHPRSRVQSTNIGDQGIDVLLDTGDSLAIDQVVFATGYRMDCDRIPFLSPPLRKALQADDGSPVLDEGFQSNVPGLYFTSLAAARDFGSFMAFTVSVRAQAKIIGDAVFAQLHGEQPDNPV